MSTVTDTPNLIRHKKIYFPDGDIAIASTKVNGAGYCLVFRIHHSTLASHSTHFADDLNAKLESNSNDQYDGIPLARYPDEPECLEGMSLFHFWRDIYLLTLLFDQRYSVQCTSGCQLVYFNHRSTSLTGSL